MILRILIFLRTAAGLRGGAARLFLLIGLLGMGLIPSRLMAQSLVLEQWAMLPASTNTATKTAPGIVGAPTAFSNIVTLTTGYSTAGQQVATYTNGSWTTGSLNRTVYEEFTVAANGFYSLRVDSLIFSSAVPSTNSGTLGVSYSAPTATPGSTAFTPIEPTPLSKLPNGGDYDAGTTTPQNGTGAYNAAPVTIICKRNAGALINTTTYRICLNGAIGVVVPVGTTLRVRIYMAVGSASAARQVYLLGVSAKGQSISLGTVAPTSVPLSFSTAAAGGYTYAITTSPAGGTAALVTAPTAGNNYLATYNISGLNVSQLYTATVTSTPTGTQPATTIVSPSFTTPSGTCPADPSAIIVSPIGQTTAAVNFTGATGSTGYTLTYYPTVALSPVVTHSLPGTATSDSFTGLTGGTNYTVTLQTNCSVNGGTGTGSMLSTTFNTLTCADPTGLIIANGTRTTTSASLSFTPGASNVSYAVTITPQGGATTTVSPAPTASPVAFTGLTPGTNYTVTLQSTCSNGAVGNVLSTTFATRLTSSPMLQQFPLIVDATDNSAVRSPGVTAGVVIPLSNFLLSDGSSNDGETLLLPAYSTAFGQGIAPAANGTGWSGFNLTKYEEFDVTAAAGGSVRLDSLVFSTGAYGSTGTVAVAYSTNAFATTGTFIYGTSSGGVTTNKVSASGFSVLHLGLAGTTGVTIAAGSTVAFRLYYYIGGNPRHILTKNLFVTGVATPTCASVSGASIGSITATSSQLNFTPGAGNTAYAVTITPQGGTTTTISPAPSTSPVAFTGLTPGTAYTVTMQTNCSGTLGYVQSLLFSTTALVCADPTSPTIANSTRTSTSASLSFTPGTSNSSFAVTYYPTGSPGSAVTVSPAPTASPVAISGLTPGTAYTVTLQSTCSNGGVGNVLSTSFNTRVSSSLVLQQFPLTVDATDNSAVRSPGVTAGVVVPLSNLMLSDGTSTDGETLVLPAYSTAFGQGIAPAANGTGWSGFGLTKYDEFDVTAATGGSVRLDSLVFSTGGYGSTATVAVAYSTNAFATTGTFIYGTSTGGITTNKVSGSGFSVLHLPLAGSTGVTIAAGSTVAFRLYYYIGSSSARHALTKNLFVTGVATPTCASVSGASISSISATGGQLNFTPGAGNTSYVVTITPQGGTATTISPAPSTSPVAFTGLTPTTAYTVTMQTNCSGTLGYTQSLYFTTTAANSSSLQQWPLTTSNADNATTRSYAVGASTPTLSGLYLSYNQVNATLGTAAIAPYSTTYGQAYSPDNSGPAGPEGGMSNGGGWSGSLSTAIYEEFIMTAATGDNLRADSLVFSTSMYGTANGKIAVAYSTDGFATSTFIKASLATPDALAANTPLTTYRLALNGGTGVARTSGQALNFRFYFAAGSTNQSRYAFLRNVYVAGEGFVNGLPNLTIGNTQSIAAGTTYGNVTVMSGGIATLSGTLLAQGVTTVQNGAVLNTACQLITGNNFTLAAGGELQICSPAGISSSGSSGAVQVTGTRSYSTDALYTYTGTYTGGANQQSGSGLPATVRTLKVNLTTATDSLQLGSNVTVGTGLLLSRGILKTYAPNGGSSYLVTMNSGSTILTETATSFVLGQVKSPTLSFVADGNSTSFGGIGVTLVAHTASAANLPLATYVLRTTGTPVYGSGSPASSSIRRRYRIVPTNDTGLNVDLTFGYSTQTAELNGIPQANLTLFSRPIAGGSWTSEGGTNNTAAKTVTKTGMTHLSDWTLGNSAAPLNATAPLPVKLTRFAAVRQGSTALVTWATASEQNSKGFAVQVSTDGREFQTAGFVASASASSSSAHEYQFVDAAPGAVGARYYRLQQLDVDGSSSYSAPQVVVFDGVLSAALTANPNPFHDGLTLTTQATAAARVAAVLTDATGRPVRSQWLDVPAGPAQLALPGLGNVPAGLYVLRLRLDGKMHYLKLIKE